MTTASERQFDAWALPRTVALPEGTGPSFDALGARVRYPEGSAEWLQTVVEALQASRAALLETPLPRIVAALGSVGERFLDPDDALRARALDLLPATSGLSPSMAAAVLDGMAADWTPARLHELLAVELDGGACLDGFVEGAGGSRVRAMGPALAVHIVSGSVPGVAATALVRSLLVKAPTLLKPGRGDVVLPVLFAEALLEAAPDLANAVAVAYWPGGSKALEAQALAAADVVTVYGDDRNVAELRSQTPVTTRFVAYHHRVSFGVLGVDALAREVLDRTAHEVAGSAAFFDQRGCVSPRVVYVEEGGEISPAEFAEALAQALADLEESLPGGRLDASESSALHQARGTAELRAGAGSGVVVHHGGAAAWTVIYDPEPAFAPSCIGRVVGVSPIGGPGEVPGLVAPFARHLQTAAVAGLGDRVVALAEALGRIGVTRVAPFDAVPFPPPWWHHDGGWTLGSLVRWVDLEE